MPPCPTRMPDDDDGGDDDDFTCSLYIPLTAYLRPPPLIIFPFSEWVRQMSHPGTSSLCEVALPGFLTWVWESLVFILARQSLYHLSCLPSNLIQT